MLLLITENTFLIIVLFRMKKSFAYKFDDSCITYTQDIKFKDRCTMNKKRFIQNEQWYKNHLPQLRHIYMEWIIDLWVLWAARIHFIITETQSTLLHFNWIILILHCLSVSILSLMDRKQLHIFMNA